MGSDSLYDLLFNEDVICSACRKQWEKAERKFLFEGMPAYALWMYGEGFSHALLQFKERGDEALAPVFLYPERKKIRRLFRGYTLCLLPSGRAKREKRGFSHLAEMAACLHMNILEPFEMIEERSQKAGSRKDRSVMRKNIRLKEGAEIPDRICLFDDVITTGATMSGALKALADRKNVRILSAGIVRESCEIQ
jgi:competence protein ComFC